MRRERGGVRRTGGHEVGGGHGELVGQPQVAGETGHDAPGTPLEVGRGISQGLGQVVHHVAAGPVSGAVRSEAGWRPGAQPLHEGAGLAVQHGDGVHPATVRRRAVTPEDDGPSYELGRYSLK